MRLVVADDSVLLREGVVRLLEEAGFEVVGQAGDAEDLLRKVQGAQARRRHRRRAHAPDPHRRGHPRRPGDPGRAARTSASSSSPSTSRRPTPASCSPTTPPGIGYLLKDRVSDIDALTDAVRRVAAGGSALDPEVVSGMLGRQRKDDPLEALTPREREVLGLMAEGRSNTRDRRAARRHRPRRREARDQHLQQARPGRHPRGPPPCAGGADVPGGLGRISCRSRPRCAVRRPGELEAEPTSR